MAEVLTTVPTPLAIGADGAIRVGGTRVTLDTILAAFDEGATAEQIVQQYPSLSLADVYQAIGYYLSRPGDFDAYLTERGRAHGEARMSNESRWQPGGIRDRLLARQR
jgi:uncharacterized protein (DUF433 family)